MICSCHYLPFSPRLVQFHLYLPCSIYVVILSEYCAIEWSTIDKWDIFLSLSCYNMGIMTNNSPEGENQHTSFQVWKLLQELVPDCTWARCPSPQAPSSPVREWSSWSQLQNRLTWTRWFQWQGIWYCLLRNFDVLVSTAKKNARIR